MMNRVKALRQKHGLTQKALASLVGTSQQQIQRIETGKIAARLEVATKLAHVLEIPLSNLFPDSKKPLEKVMHAFRSEKAPPNEAYVALSRAGIEADIREWFFKVRLRGHKDSLQFRISPDEQRRLFQLVQRENSPVEGLSFVVFDTNDSRIAINVRELVYCHFLFEGFPMPEEEPESSYVVEVFLAGDEKALHFAVEPDDGDPDDEEEGQFRGIFFDMELHVEETERFYFEDEDAEDVFLRAGDVALLKVPLPIIDLEYESEEDFDEPEDEVEVSSSGIDAPT